MVRPCLLRLSLPPSAFLARLPFLLQMLTAALHSNRPVRCASDSFGIVRDLHSSVRFRVTANSLHSPASGFLQDVLAQTTDDASPHFHLAIAVIFRHHDTSSVAHYCHGTVPSHESAYPETWQHIACCVKRHIFHRSQDSWHEVSWPSYECVRQTT